MVLIHRPGLLSAAVVALMATGITWLVGRVMLPRMQQQGNALMVREVVAPLEAYFSDFQAWPAGTAEETVWRLQGAKDDVIGPNATDAAPAPPSPNGAVVGSQSVGSAEATTLRRQLQIPFVNYLRDARVRSVGLTLGDAWGRSMQFSFIPQGPAKVTSLGRDGVLGTADDTTATAHIMPRNTQPTRALFFADREFRRFEEIKRLEHARRLADKVK